MSDPVFQVVSPAFAEGGWIPKEHAQNGANRSPELRPVNPPKGTKGFAVVMADVTKPEKPVYQWAIWNIPVLDAIPAGVPAEAAVAALGGAAQSGSYHNHRYKGPGAALLGGPHTYKFTLIALSGHVELDCHLFPEEFLAGIGGYVLGEATLSGKYKRGNE